MPINIGACPQSQWQTLLPLLACLNPVSLNAKDVENWSGGPNSRRRHKGLYLFLYLNPVHAVAQAMDKGVSPCQAYKRWREETRQWLDIYRRNQGHAMLVDVQEIHVAPERFLSLINKKFRLNKPSNEYVATGSTGPVDYINFMIAKEYVQKEAGKDGMMEGLKENGWSFAPGYDYLFPISEGEYFKNLYEESIRRIYDKKSTGFHERDRDKMEAKLNAVQKVADRLYKENSMLLEELHSTQETLEESAYNINKLKDAKDKTLQSYEMVKSRLASFELQAEESRVSLFNMTSALNKERCEHQRTREYLAGEEHANYLMLKTLHATQEMLEKHMLEKSLHIKNVERTRYVAEYKAAQANQRLRSIKESISWKLTSPVRMLGKKRKGSEWKLISRQADLIRESGLFDPNWYCKTYPDVTESGIDPVEHFVRFGAGELRNPGPDFDCARYIEENPGVAQEKINPLVHYIESTLGKNGKGGD